MTTILLVLDPMDQELQQIFMGKFIFASCLWLQLDGLVRCWQGWIESLFSFSHLAFLIEQEASRWSCPPVWGSCCWPLAGATLSTWLFSYSPAHSSFGLFLQQTILDFCTWQLNSFSANVEDLLRSRFWSPRMPLLPYSTGQSKVTRPAQIQGGSILWEG